MGHSGGEFGRPECGEMQTVKTQILRFHAGIRALPEMNDWPFVLYSNKESGYIRPVFQEID